MKANKWQYMFVLYLNAKVINYGDVVRLWFVGVGQQYIIRHHLHWVQSKLLPLFLDLLSIFQVLLSTSQVGKACELPVGRMLAVRNAKVNLQNLNVTLWCSEKIRLKKMKLRVASVSLNNNTSTAAYSCVSNVLYMAWKVSVSVRWVTMQAM